jgi:hypothetical protein
LHQLPLKTEILTGLLGMKKPNSLAIKGICDQVGFTWLKTVVI